MLEYRPCVAWVSHTWNGSPTDPPVTAIVIHPSHLEPHVLTFDTGIHSTFRCEEVKMKGLCMILSTEIH